MHTNLCILIELHINRNKQSMTCDVRLQLVEVRCAVASCDVCAEPTLVVTCDVCVCGAF